MAGLLDSLIPRSTSPAEAEFMRNTESMRNMLSSPVPRDPAYEYGNILPFRKPVSGGPAEWHPLYSNTLASLFDAVTAPVRAWQGQQLDPRDAMNVGLSVLGTNAVAGPRLGPGELGATVFHGSPHMFDKFDMNKVGTGEGAQAYGRGLYFAERPEVASAYKGSGSLYKTDLPDQHIPRMIDWDKPLSSQSAEVKQALGKINNPLVQEALARDWTGHKLVTTLQQALSRQEPIPGMPAGVTRTTSGPEETRQLLLKAGIPGVKYLDAGSRGSGTGTRNYAVFDDSLVKILETMK